MKKTLLLITLVLATSSLGRAGSCSSAPLSTYIAKGFSCTETINGIDGLRTLKFSGFKETIGPPPGTLSVTVLPNGFEFGKFSVGKGQVEDFSLDYVVSGDLDAIALDIEKFGITGNGTGKGAILGTENIAVPCGKPHCRGSHFLGSINVYDNTRRGTLSSATLILPEVTGPFTLEKDLVLSGRIGSNSTASVGELSNEFNTVPEPASMILFGTGLLALGGYIRRRLPKNV
jgi:hypothetical protein